MNSIENEHHTVFTNSQSTKPSDIAFKAVHTGLKHFFLFLGVIFWRHFFPAEELFGTPPLAFLLTGLEVLLFFTGLSSVLQFYSKNNMHINSHVFTTTISKHRLLLLGLSTLIDLYRLVLFCTLGLVFSLSSSSESSSSYLLSSLLHSSWIPENVINFITVIYGIIVYLMTIFLLHTAWFYPPSLELCHQL